MVRLTIDGRSVEVADGSTILDAAAALGIEIPTLCRVEGLRPLTTCFLCVVQVVGQHKLAPACAMPAADGMVVVTDSPEVRSARRTALELLFSDHLGECLAPCEISCPANLRIPAFMDHLANGRVAEAAALAAEDLVLPGVLGWICPRFCENACRRQERDAAVAIAELHKGLSAANGHGGLLGQGVIEAKAPATEAAGGRAKRVAVVGAGPAGLAAAHLLLRAGHACTIIDEQAAGGGALRRWLDRARVPGEVLDAEVEAVRRRGAVLRMNTRLGSDVTLEQLRREFDAVVLAVGATRWQPLACPGGELARPAGEWLGAGPGSPPGAVAVIGAAVEAVETARSLRRRGAGAVTVICARGAEHLALLSRQVRAAEAEGVAFQFGCRVAAIAAGGSGCGLVVTIRSADGVERAVEFAGVVAAVGRDADLGLLGGQGLGTTARGVKVNKDTLATTVGGVFAAGDVISGGGGFCVRAVAYGRAAAESVDRMLRGAPGGGRRRAFTVRYGRLADEERATLLAAARNAGPRREAPAGAAAIRAEAERCLMCGCRENDACRLRKAGADHEVDLSRFQGERRALGRDESHPLVVYESHKCIMCGACVAVVESAAQKLGLTYIGRGFSVRVGAPLDAALADALGDLARRCAEVCPTSAIVLKRR